MRFVNAPCAPIVASLSGSFDRPITLSDAAGQAPLHPIENDVRQTDALQDDVAAGARFPRRRLVNARAATLTLAFKHEPSARASSRPAARRHHHGWQRPLGEETRPAPDRRPPA